MSTVTLYAVYKTCKAVIKSSADSGTSGLRRRTRKAGSAEMQPQITCLQNLPVVVFSGFIDGVVGRDGMLFSLLSHGIRMEQEHFLFWGGGVRRDRIEKSTPVLLLISCSYLNCHHFKEYFTSLAPPHELHPHLPYLPPSTCCTGLLSLSRNKSFLPLPAALTSSPCTCLSYKIIQGSEQYFHHSSYRSSLGF